MQIKQKKQLLSKILYFIMKAVAIQTFIAVLFAGIAIAHDIKAQNILEKTISLKIDDQQIKNVLSKIEKQTQTRFMYAHDIIQASRKISFSATEEKLGDLLKKILSPLNIIYEVSGNNIILTYVEPLDLLIPEGNKSQFTITGNVTDENKMPLPGVNISIKGTANGTISDGGGNYSLQVPENSKALTFSFIGYTTQEIEIGTQREINIVLLTDNKTLNEVVVIGYGSVKKGDLTGSVANLNEKNFNGGIVTAPEQLMQGKLSGVSITLNSGQPGANSNVRIRGGTSITASNDPLYVIDGVPVAYDGGNYSTVSDRQSALANNPLNMLNPSDIKSIDVLKDASATAIYGSRGANGVIIITTKQGQSGKAMVEYDASIGVSTLRKRIDVLSADEFRNYINKSPDIKGWVDGKSSTDWQKQIFRTGITKNHSLALSGGSQNTTYRASLNYSNQEGIILKSALEKVVGRINLTHKALKDKLTFNLFLNNAYLKNTNAPVPESSGGDGSGGLIRDALRQDPTYPIKDSSGAYTYHGVLNQNPIEESNTLIDQSETSRFLSSLKTTYKLFDFLSADINFGLTRESIARYFYAPIASRIGGQSHGLGSQEAKNSNSNLLEINLVFNKTFGNHHLNVLGGYSYQDFFYKGSFISAKNFITDANTYDNIGGGDRNTFNLGTYKNANRLISFYGRATYDFKNKYYFTVTVRQDGSSKFGPNNKRAIFPSAALAWKISEESFLQNSSIINNLKLRLSYGITGNQGIQNYLSQSILSVSNNQYIVGGVSYKAVGASQLPNPNIKWESTATTDLGIDFGFLGGRLNGTLDVYRKRTTDLLLEFKVPSPSVVGTLVDNVGEVENKGIELDLNGVLIQKKSVKVEVYGNLTHNQNKVISISKGIYQQTQIYLNSTNSPGFSGVNTEIIIPGQPLGTYYGYKYNGVENGVEKFVDVNNDGKITPGDDRMIIGNYRPNLLYGFGTNITFHQFNLSIFFRGVQGVSVLNSTALDLQNISRLPLYNVTRATLSDGVKYGESAQYSSRWIQNASFLRLQNIRLGYNFNVSSIKWLSRASLYITGQNLFVITKYKGFDPEVSNGVDFANYPTPRTVLLGLSVAF